MWMGPVSCVRRMLNAHGEGLESRLQDVPVNVLHEQRGGFELAESVPRRDLPGRRGGDEHGVAAVADDPSRRRRQPWVIEQPPQQSVRIQ